MKKIVKILLAMLVLGSILVASESAIAGTNGPDPMPTRNGPDPTIPRTIQGFGNNHDRLEALINGENP